eukprot:Selendium_serpulae@DN6146_c0_g4_i1.p1
MRSLREWSGAGDPLPERGEAAPEPGISCLPFRVVSFNCLANSLVDNKYDAHDKQYMHWESRKAALSKVVLQQDADILALQEIDDEEFDCFKSGFAQCGYEGRFKKKTGDKKDGVATFWRSGRFKLLKEEELDFHFTETGVMYGHQVAKFVVLKDIVDPVRSNCIIVANTHIIFNSKRGDTKLGQIGHILEVVYRLYASYSEILDCSHNTINPSTGSGASVEPFLVLRNCPSVVMCGDFNLTPQSALYSWLSSGELDFHGLQRQTLSGQVAMLRGDYDVDRTGRDGLGSAHGRFQRDGDKTPPPGPVPATNLFKIHEEHQLAWKTSKSYEEKEDNWFTRVKWEVDMYCCSQ